MQLPSPLLLLFLTACTLTFPLHRKRHIPPQDYVLHKFRRAVGPVPLHILSNQTAHAARSAAERKYRDAPTLLVSHSVRSGYSIPSSLQTAYDHASDQATNLAILTPPHFKPIVGTDIHSTVGSSVGVMSVANSSIVVPLTDQILGDEDIEYYGSLAFGSQSQKLQVDFDTGSADLWIPVDCDNCKTLPQFQARDSATYQNTGQPFSVTYGFGDVNGTVAFDTVSIGAFKVNQSFGAVSSVSENFARSPSSGIVGLAFSSLSASRGPTFFENLMNLQGFLQAPLFSIYLTRDQSEGSEVCFGCIDVSKATGKDVQWAPVIHQAWWTVNMFSITVGKSSISANIFTIVDSGTSFIYVPDRFASSVYSLIPGSKPASDYSAGFYTYPCDTQVEISFILGNQTISMNPRDFSLGLDKGSSSVKMCIGSIIGWKNFSFAILGDSLLKSYVSVYDYSHGSRVGFVRSINP